MPQRSRGRAATGGAGRSALPADLLDAVVHEVGNLLAASRLSAHLLASEGAEAERASLAHDIEDLAAQAGALLAQLRPLLAEEAPAPHAIACADLLEALRAAFADRPPGGTRVEVAAGHGLPALRGEPDALHQVLLALLYGALDAVRPRGCVQVGAASEGRRVALTLVDDGPPVDLRALHRGPAVRGRELALRLADAVLRRMGGRVRAETPARGGTRVSLLLPAARSGAGGAAARSPR